MDAADWVTWPRFVAELAARPVVVLMGGTSTEREVSLASGRAVLGALRAPGGPTEELQPPIIDVEIAADGRWFVGGTPQAPAAALGQLPADALFLLALHGGAGEDGRMQAFLELAGRVYTGPGHAASALCMHKGRTRLVAADAGVAVAPGFLVVAAEWSTRRAEVLERAAALPGDVRFVKHATGGSSVLVFRCPDAVAVEDALERVAAAGGDAVVEAGVAGLEVSCGVVGDGDRASALPVIEILPRGGTGFFDFDEKYSAEGALARCPAEALGDVGEALVRSAALQTWAAVGGSGYGRVDFIVPGRDRDEAPSAPVLLEVNTLPGFTPRSLLPREAAAAGVDYRELCFEVLARGLARAPE